MRHRGPHRHKYAPVPEGAYDTGQETCIMSRHYCSCGRSLTKRKRRPKWVTEDQCTVGIHCLAHPNAAQWIRGPAPGVARPKWRTSETHTEAEGATPSQ